MQETVEKKLCPECGRQMSYYINQWNGQKEWYCEHCDED